eukprot:362722-Chlamydomonas_euryale.AAC.1
MHRRLKLLCSVSGLRLRRGTSRGAARCGVPCERAQALRPLLPSSRQCSLQRSPTTRLEVLHPRQRAVGQRRHGCGGKKRCGLRDRRAREGSGGGGCGGAARRGASGRGRFGGTRRAPLGVRRAHRQVWPLFPRQPTCRLRRFERPRAVRLSGECGGCRGA